MVVPLIVAGCVFGGYVVSSMVLLKVPTILHRKKEVRFNALHISHRGGAAEKLENTLEAFKHAQAQGTDMFELDCQLTRDGQVVVSHDDNLKRVCGVDMDISNTDYKDLPAIMPTVKVDFFPSLYGKGDDRRIPLLEEVFQLYPNMPINIDIKRDNDDLMSEVHLLIKKYDRHNISVWGNKSHAVCNKLYKLDPTVPLLFSLRKVLTVTLLFWTGLLPFVPLRESRLEILMPGLLLEAEAVFGKQMGRTVKIVSWIADSLIMRPALLSHLEKRGIPTYIWVLNREEDFERALHVGAAGIMTDRPTLLADYLQKEGQANQPTSQLIGAGDCRRRHVSDQDN